MPVRNLMYIYGQCIDRSGLGSWLRSGYRHRVSVPPSQYALDNLPQPCLGAPADVFRWTWALLVLPRPFLWVGPSGGEKKKKPDHGHHVVNLAQSGLPTEGHTISMQLNS